MTFNPEPVQDQDSLIFTWQDPKPGKYDFGLQSTVEVANEFVKVKDKIPFPLTDIPEELKPYAEPSKNIDSDNEDIQRLASELAAGEDDEFVVAHKMASWVEQNVEYSLDTLTADTSQKASWVLTNRRGVCDELSSLFIAMCRSVGLPARYMSGMAYTNYKDKNDWGPHAWAEVYFQGYGWVPFDLTYRQFGIIDPSHIILKESIDSDDASTDYEWKARDVDINTEKLKIDVAPVNLEGKAKEYLSINAEALKDDIGFGSYNLVQATIKNNNDFYYSTEISIAKVNDLNIIDNARIHALLKPGEEKKMFWRIKVREDLQRRYIYTIPILVYTTQNTTAESSFTATDQGEYYSNEYVSSIMQEGTEEAEKAYSRNVDVNCAAEKPEIYFYEEPNIYCVIKNTGNAYIDSLDVCVIGQVEEKKCRTLNIGISQQREANFTLNNQEAGVRDFRITASNALVSKSDDLKINVLDEPKILIDEIYYPENVSFKDAFNVSFVLKRKSYSLPQQVSIMISQNTKKRTFTKEVIDKNERFIMSFPARDLKWGENKYSIEVEFYDKNGKGYSETEEFSVNLSKASIFDRIYIFFNNLFHRIS
jgi:hypothetical protein